MEGTCRILLLPSATGGGHFRASLAVAAELEKQGAEVTVIDVLKDYAPWPFSTVPGSYSGMLVGGGIIYGWIFRLLDHPGLLAPFHRILWPYLRSSARRLLKERESDLIVVSHPLPVCAVARAAREAGGPTVVGFTTDLVIGHSLNVSPDVKHYMVASQQVCKQLEERGVKAKIHEVGLPIAPEFEQFQTVEPEELRSELGLDPDRPVVLLMTGGVGWGDVDDLIKELLGIDLPIQMVVVAGSNEELRKRLHQVFRDSEVHVKGFLDEIHRWMRASDVLITKAGPNTIAEALATGIPLLLTSAIPAQETPNVDWIVESGAGRWTPDPTQCAEAVREILNNEKLAAEMRARSRQLARPSAARDAANLLLQIVRTESES